MASGKAIQVVGSGLRWRGKGRSKSDVSGLGGAGDGFSERSNSRVNALRFAMDVAKQMPGLAARSQAVLRPVGERLRNQSTMACKA
jgi:hypothetical protein